MATFAYPRSTHCALVTLTTADTKYSLWSLLTAIDATIPTHCNELVLQADESNVAALVRIGNVNLSTTRYGYTLLAGASRTYVSRSQQVDMQDIYLLADTNGAKVSVEIINF